MAIGILDFVVNIRQRLRSYFPDEYLDKIKTDNGRNLYFEINDHVDRIKIEVAPAGTVLRVFGDLNGDSFLYYAVNRSDINSKTYENLIEKIAKRSKRLSVQEWFDRWEQ